MSEESTVPLEAQRPCLYLYTLDLEKRTLHFQLSPSAAETVTQTADHIQEKLASSTVSRPKPQTEVVEVEATPPGQVPSIESQYKTPLDLSGALDHFDSFDVTPAIGREFVGVNLARWLKAPNSDELIRDLAITSTKLSH